MRRASLTAREVKLLAEPVAAVDPVGLFEGYASLFGIADLGKDVVMPGAFADSLARRGPSGIRMLWQHDAGQPIGRWLSIAEDPRGLKVRGRLNLAVERARDVHALIKRRRGRRPVDRLSRRARPRRASDRAAPAREARPVGDLDRHLPDAARRTGRRREGRAPAARGDDPLLRAPAVRSAAAGFRPLGAHRNPAAKTPAPRASRFLTQGTS